VLVAVPAVAQNKTVAPEVAKAKYLWSKSPHGRMLERILPPAIEPDGLPEPSSEGARLTALQGAQILFYPTAIGWHPSEKAEYGEAQRSAWETIQRSHAIANGVFVASTNRVGHEGPKDGGIEFFGNTFIADPYGKVMHRAGAAEEIVVLECDLALVDTARVHWPFLRDRRIDAYGDITRRYID